MRQLAADRGWRVTITSEDICLTRGERTIWLKATEIYVLLFSFDAVETRSLVEKRQGRWVSDLRGPARYRTTRTSDVFWIRKLIDLHNPVDGYLLRGDPAPGDLVFDAGAFEGEFSLVAARLVGPSGRVVAFEPDPENRVWLERNICEAGITNITICPCGLWSESTEIEFAADGTCGSRAAVFEDSGVDSSGIQVLGLAEAADQFGVPDFIKMDIEGAEIEVIKGAASWLTQHAVRFAIASYHERDGQITSELLEPMFRKVGYEAATGYPEHRTTWAWRS